MVYLAVTVLGAFFGHFEKKTQAPKKTQAQIVLKIKVLEVLCYNFAKNSRYWRFYTIDLPKTQGIGGNFAQTQRAYCIICSVLSVSIK